MSKFSTSAASDYLTSLPRKTHFNIFTSWHWIQFTYRDFKKLTVINPKNRNKYTPRKRGLRRHLAWNIPIQTGNSIKSAFAVQEFAKRAHQMQKLLTCTRQSQIKLRWCSCQHKYNGVKVIIGHFRMVTQLEWNSTLFHRCLFRTRWITRHQHAAGERIQLIKNTVH